jgi:hypothetical protein
VIFRKRFGELIDRQLTLFEDDHAELLERIARASEAYDEAPREEAEERYADYQDLLTEGADVLVQLRDNYAESLDHDAADEYEVAFNYAVLRRFGDIALELEDEPD